MNLNKIQIIGRLTKSPELKMTKSGMEVCTLSVATNHRFKKGEESEDKTTFHNVVAFGKTAQAISKYFVKGQEIYVEGRQENESWQKEDGTYGNRSQIILEKFEFGQKPKNYQEDANEEKEVKEESQEYPEGEINPEDIPF